ncbi:HNH endonuclease [bacterium]|nr:HNH endonuclease [bacterium]
MEERISEAQLVIPTLKLLSIHDNGLSTSDLIAMLTEVMQPSGKDVEVISGRSDTYFSQKVRNLRSHKTLERYNFAEYVNKKYYITEIGLNFLEVKYEEYEYINSGHFDVEDQKIANLNLLGASNRYFVLEEEVSEGKLVTTNSKTRKRSQKLRNYAFEYYKSKNKIKCEVCGFDFEITYGALGKNYIELHHIKPVSIYEENGEISNLEEARLNLVPLCSNCHKILHRNNINVEKLKEVFQNER